MPRWKQGIKEFEIPVSGDVEKGAKVNIPKPIMDMWNRPTKIKFVIGREGKVSVEPA